MARRTASAPLLRCPLLRRARIHPRQRRHQHPWQVAAEVSPLEQRCLLSTGVGAIHQAKTFKPNVKSGNPVILNFAGYQWDARGWLLLSVIDASADAAVAIETLKMAYYTGAGNPALVPWLLKEALRFPAIADPDVQKLAEEEIKQLDEVSALPPEYPGWMVPFQNMNRLADVPRF